MERNLYDVIIIGSGIAGLFTAVNIDSNLSVLIVTKESIISGSSPLAQGGIVSQVNRDIHEKDTIRAGSGYNCLDALNKIGEYSKACINDLISLGVEFDRDEEGNLLYTLEGGHSIKTILHCRDYTGLSIMKVLEGHVSSRANITVIENTMAVDIINHESYKELVTIGENSSSYYCRSLVIATGGVGRVYGSTTNPDEITGDGIAMAIRSGINICDLEFVQFHPTALYSRDTSRKKLVSEALRGEGAILRNLNNERFMDSQHPLKSLAPRDIVSRAIFSQMERNNSKYVYLDITSRSESFLKNRFPSIYDSCLNQEINIAKDYIKVAPAQHYIMGGIKVNNNGMTNIDNIYACGECARTGFHGANRLASNSLLEAIVYGRIIGESISRNSQVTENCYRYEVAATCGYYIEDTIDFTEIKQRIGTVMDRYVSIVRSKASLIKGKNSIEDVLSLLGRVTSRSREYYEAVNMGEVALAIIEASLNRKESLGAFYRID
ncbi:MAG: L-aspartate oxidase [Clostridium sp.]